jgi:hypothetical protein
MDYESNGDITMDDITPASTVPPTDPEPHVVAVVMDADVDIDKQGHAEPEATAGEELTEEEVDIITVHNIGSKNGEQSQDTIMEECSVPAAKNADETKLEHGVEAQSYVIHHSEKFSQSNHLLPPLPYSSEAQVHAVKAPALSGLLTAKDQSSNKKPAQKNSANEKGHVLVANKAPKPPVIPSRKDSAAIEKPSNDSSPSAPTRHKKQKQTSGVSSPVAAPSPLEALLKSVNMGRKESFSKGQESADETPKTMAKGKGKSSKSGNAAIVAKTDEELLGDFVFMPKAEVESLLAPALRKLLRGVKSLGRFHNGVNKTAMQKHYMAWQEKMQALKDAEQANAGAEEEKEEEEEDVDAEEETDDELMDSPVTGKVTPGPPLKSPFTDQPRSIKQTPLLNKLTKAARESSSGSLIVRRHTGRSKTSFEAQDNDGESEDQNEPAVYKKFLEDEAKDADGSKRSRRSISRPATYKE